MPALNGNSKHASWARVPCLLTLQVLHLLLSTLALGSQVPHWRTLYQLSMAFGCCITSPRNTHHRPGFRAFKLCKFRSPTHNNWRYSHGSVAARCGFFPHFQKGRSSFCTPRLCKPHSLARARVPCPNALRIAARTYCYPCLPSGPKFSLRARDANSHWQLTLHDKPTEHTSTTGGAVMALLQLDAGFSTLSTSRGSAYSPMITRTPIIGQGAVCALLPALTVIPVCPWVPISSCAQLHDKPTEHTSSTRVPCL